LLRFSYWIPQIGFTALENHRRSVSIKYAVFMSIGQIAFTWAMVAFHPHWEAGVSDFMYVIVLYVAIQLCALFLQNQFGGAFFLPARLRKRTYDYLGEKPPEGTECSICLGEIREDARYLTTPCHHHFHDACLRRWLEEHPNCPMCRSVLPPVDVDPPAE
jgi:hypothetical protein